jgi:hypothetical protein
MCEATPGFEVHERISGKPKCGAAFGHFPGVFSAYTRWGRSDSSRVVPG